MVASTYRPLSAKEWRLASWMLKNGNADAAAYLAQLETAEAIVWRCECGCATFKFKIKDRPEAPPGTHVLADFVFFDGADLAGAFIYSSQGTLAGVEVYGLAGDAPTELPEPADLMTHEAYGRDYQNKS